MRASVQAALPPSLGKWEGRLAYMYLDTKGYVTCGTGNKIDPMAACLAYPWLHKLDGTPATQAEIVAEWNTVKAAQALKRLGGGAYARLTKLYLPDAFIDSLLVGVAGEMEGKLRGEFEAWDQFPAPAQLAIMDMAWNMGPEFGFPKFREYANQQDWGCASTECKIVDAPEGRNEWHAALFLQASKGGDPDGLVV